MNQLKYTILIPTRDRADTLKYAITSCLSDTYSNYEILVSDNCSTDNTEALVRSFNNEKIKYVKTPKRVSMSENFEYGLSFINDGYVMIIGDDDGIVPGAISYVDKIIKETGVKAVVSSIAQYVWPNHANEKTRNLISWSVGEGYEVRETELWLRKMLNFEPVYTFDLPGLYCGFVHIDSINKMKKDGKFFYSQTPDAYSAFAISVVEKKYVFSSVPFSIHGASGRSNGSSYLEGKNKSESQSFFKENTIPFHANLELCPSYRMIAAEAFLQLKDNFPEKVNGYCFNYYQLLKMVKLEINEYNRDLINKAISSTCQKNNLDVEKIENFKINWVNFWIMKLKLIPSRIRNLRKFSRVKDASLIGVNNIHEASIVIGVFLSINNGSIDNGIRRLSEKLKNICKF